MSNKKNVIVKLPNDVLRQKAQKIENFDLKFINDLFTQMSAALAETKHGVAIAAPQIGKSLQAFVVSGKVLSVVFDKENMSDKIFINPEIKFVSKEKSLMKEGCLSVPNRYGSVLRHKKVTIKYFDEKGNKKIQKAKGFLAQIFQHEIDHLNGVLFIDKVDKLYETDEDFNIIRQIK